jgi:cytochrome b pre-mRNA-processing protein 3
MLHMYLIVARIRCLDRDAARSTQAQFVDNFFFDCERVMHVNHGMTSSALRQRYLKDIFMQWRGLIAAYDEGIAKADDLDFRHLAAVVAWMRATLRDLETCPIEDVLSRPQTLFRRDPRTMLALVDEPSRGLKELYAAQPGEAATAEA